jgi:microcystin-dependent protein
MDESYIGFVTLFAGNFAPRNWAFCDGSLLPIASNTALFSILGTTYGGNGKNTFALPDLRGRAVIGAGQGLSVYDPGELGGVEMVGPLAIKNIPAHTHAIQMTIKPHAAGVANSLTPKDAVYATTANQSLYEFSSDVNMASYTAKIATTAQGVANPQLVPVLHPVLALNYIICMTGAFPPRS